MMIHSRRWLGIALVPCCLLLLFAGYLPGADWANWRGPFNNGVSPDTGLPAKWSPDPKEPENFLWKADYGCRSTPIVMNDRVYLNNQVGEGVNEQERVMCLDAKDGKLLWEKKFNVFHTDIVSVRLGWTHMAGDPATGNVFWHGTQGYLTCFDKDGNIVWQRQLTELDGRISGYGGRLPSPVLAGDVVVIGMVHSSWGDQAKAANRFLALDKRNGTPVWWSTAAEKPGTYFSTPVAANINGQNLIITGGSDGAIHALQAGTGKVVWSYVFCKGAINCSPAVDGTLVYANHGEESPGTNEQGRIICVDAGQITDKKPKLVWEVDGIEAKYASPLVHGGRVYIAEDAAKLFCLDGKTGKEIWSHRFGRNAMASPVWGDGKIFLSNKNGGFNILQPGEDKCKTLSSHRFESLDGQSDVESYGNVAIANGRVYVPTRDQIYCLATKEAKAGNGPPATAEIKKGKPAQLSIYPCDIVTHPGGQAALKVRVYDEFGNFLEEVAKADEVNWTLPVPKAPAGAKAQPSALQADLVGGTLPAKLTVKSAPMEQYGLVEAEWKGLKATARVRVAPTLPYAGNFESVADGGVPAGWVNCQGKFVVKTLADGNHVLAKNTSTSNATIASGSCFFGTPEVTNYTIEADVLGGKIDKEGNAGIWLPDVGIGACRYTLLLGGQTQTLRLISWDAMPRVDRGVQFPWKERTWYRLKLTAAVDAKGATTLSGKAWVWGEKEPEKWNIVYTDPTPNREGAPFLYGYVLGHVEPSPGTDVYFDNVRVTPNSPTDKGSK